MAASNIVEIVINAVDQTRAAVASAEKSLGGLKNIASSITAALAGIGAGISFQAIIDAADSVTSLQDKLKLATGSTTAATTAYQALFDIAQRSRVNFTELGDTYASLSRATNGMGISQTRLLNVTESISNAITISGSSAQAAQGAMQQFGQGMAAGALRGEELNSVLEGTPRLASAIAAGMGVAVGDLKKLGEAGKLTAEEVIKALEKQADTLAAEVQGANLTVAQSFTLLKNALTNFTGQADAATGTTKTLATTVKALADYITSLGKDSEKLASNLRSLGEILLAIAASKAAMMILELVSSFTKLKAVWGALVPVAASWTAIHWFDIGQDVAKATAETEKLTASVKRGAAETELLVRASKELDATGALSLKTQLDLAALAAQKVAEKLPAAADALKQIGTSADNAGNAIKSALQNEVSKASDTVKNLSAAYKTAENDIQSGLKDRLSVIDNTYKQQVEAAKTAGMSEAQTIAATTQALIDAEGQKTAAIFNAAKEMDATWQASYDAATALAKQAADASIEAAKAAGTGVVEAETSAAASIAQVQRDLMSQKLSAYEQIASAYRSTVDKLIAEESRHLQAAKDAEEARYNLKLSVEDRIRALLQKGMDNVSAHADRQKQIDEKQSAARQALAEGDYEKARKLSEETLSLIERNASEVTQKIQQNGKETTVVVESQGVASVKAMGEMRESAGIADEALQKLAASHTSAGTAAGQGAAAAKSALEGVTAEITTLRAALEKQGQLAITVNTEAAKQGIAAIQADLAAASLVAKIQADTAAAQDSVKSLQAQISAIELTAKVAAANGLTPDSVAALKAETEKMVLMAKVDADTSKVLTGIEALKTTAAASNIKIPALASFDQPYAALRDFASETQRALSQPTTHTHTVRADTSRAKSEIQDLQRDTSSTHTIYVRKVEKNATGGLVGSLQRFAAGGQAWADRTASAYRRMSGRITGPGTATSDSIPAMLSAGEYVIKTSSVRQFGQAMFDALNAGHLPAALMPAGAFATGGPVLSGLFDAPGSSSTGTRDVVDIRLNIGSQTLPLQSSRATAMQLASALRQLSRGA